jgi:predicted ATP-grasp superfamily ATP-dependent carboligase
MGNEHTLTNLTHSKLLLSAEKLIQGHGFLFLKDGSVSASLLNEGASRGLDAMILFVNSTTEADFHAAALLSKSISRLVPGVHCDLL